MESNAKNYNNRTVCYSFVGAWKYIKKVLKHDNKITVGINLPRMKYLVEQGNLRYGAFLFHLTHFPVKGRFFTHRKCDLTLTWMKCPKGYF